MIRTDNAIAGIHAKSGCYICQSANDLIDLEVTIDYEGVLAICRGCVHDMAQTAGYNLDITVEELDALQTELAEANFIADSVLGATTQAQEVLSDIRKKHRDRLRQYRQRQAKQKAAAEVEA